MKRNKIKVVAPVSREAFEAAANTAAAKMAAMAAIKAGLEEETARLQAAYQVKISSLVEEVDALVAGCEVYATRNKDLFEGRKSIDLLSATVGFRTTPPRVERLTNETWERVALRMEAMEWGEPYLKQARPTLNKEALLNARGMLEPEQLTVVGICFAQDELFYLEPKGDLAQAVAA